MKLQQYGYLKEASKKHNTNKHNKLEEGNLMGLHPNIKNKPNQNNDR